MQNKLPEVGKRYKNKQCYDNVYIVTAVYPAPFTKRVAIEAKPEFLHCKQNGWILSFFNGTLEEFWDCFEELPEDKSNQERIMQAHAESGKFGNSFADVERAKEELRIELEYPCCYSQDMKEKAKNLLNTLDSQEPKKETKLPWKPVSELPEVFEHKTYVVKFEDGTISDAIFDYYGQCVEPRFQINGQGYYPKIKYWIETTDLINSIESILSRQDELEAKIKKLEWK